MSSWIQYNKPSAIVGGLGLVLFLGLAGWGVTHYLEAGDINKKIDSAKSNISSMGRKAIAPTEESLNQTNELIEKYQVNMEDIAKSYNTFRANSVLRSQGSQDFQNQLKAERADWLANCKEKGIAVADDASWMGFNSYASGAPITQAVPILSFQKAGIENLLNIMMQNGVVKFTSVHRPGLAEETATKKTDEAPERAADKPAWRDLPFEVTFSGKRESVVKILNALAASDKYLYTFSGMRIKNQNQSAPVIKTEQADAKPASTGGISYNPSVASGGAAENDEPAAPVTEVILERLLGKETINVHLALNLVYFYPESDSAEEGQDPGDENEGGEAPAIDEKEPAPDAPADPPADEAAPQPVPDGTDGVLVEEDTAEEE